MWISFFREEVFEENDSENQKAHCDSDEHQSPHCTSEGRAAHSQNAGKLLALNYHVYPSFPHLRTDIPLSSTDCDDSKEEDGHVGTVERVAQFRWDSTQGENGYCSEGASDQTDPEGGVRGKSRETWNTEGLEESVPGVEETEAGSDAEREREEDQSR
jgi:hypothetical protein